MGLCISKKDALAIHGRAPLSLRDQMLSDLAREAHDLIGSCPSPSASVVSTSTMESSISALPISMEKRYGGSITASLQLMRSLNNSTNSNGTLDEYDDDDATSTTTRFSTLSTSSSPMIQSIDASYGMDNVTRSYAKHKASLEEDQQKMFVKTMKMQQKQSRMQQQRLLEINEEDEEQLKVEASEDELDHEMTKKTARKSLDVFGEVFKQQHVFIPSILQQQQQQQHQAKAFQHPEISVFAADRYFETEASESETGISIRRTSKWAVEDQHHYSASEDDDSASNISCSTMSTAVHLSKNTPGAFMAVPTSHDVWPNFAHMNPSAAAARFRSVHKNAKTKGLYSNEDARSSFSADEVSTTTYGTDSGDDSVISTRKISFGQGQRLPKSQLGRSSSSPTIYEEEKMRMQERFRAHFQGSSNKVHPSNEFSGGYHRKNKSFTYMQDEEEEVPDSQDVDVDDFFDSDDSNDLFEIEAALGSSPSDKEFAYGNQKTGDGSNNNSSSFLNDPDISHTTKFSGSSFKGHELRNCGKIKVLNPTLRANVIILPSSLNKRKGDHQSSNKHKPHPRRQHQSSLRSYGMFHGR